MTLGRNDVEPFSSFSFFALNPAFVASYMRSYDAQKEIPPQAALRSIIPIYYALAVLGTKYISNLILSLSFPAEMLVHRDND